MKILINGITLDNANIVPLLTNVRYFQDRGAEITVIGSTLLNERINQSGILNNFIFFEIESRKKISSNLDLITEGLKRNFLAIRSIKKMRERYDVVYSRSSVLDLLIFPYALKSLDKKIKWVAVFDNTVTWPQTSRKIAWFFYLLSLVLLKKVDTIFAVSDELKKYLVTKGFHDKKIVVTGNAVEAELINKALTDGRYSLDALFVGRINEQKGVFDMLEVLSEVVKKYPNFQLGIVGKGDSSTESEFKKKINEMKLKDNVQLFGYVVGQEKYNIIKSSRVFWSLSRSESFGLALLEAVASGKPALVYGIQAYNKIYLDNEIYRFKK